MSKITAMDNEFQSCNLWFVSDLKGLNSIYANQFFNFHAFGMYILLFKWVDQTTETNGIEAVTQHLFYQTSHVAR